ncbi:arginine:ornithine antiporter [Haladaptatus sp. R4]|uniref:arginine/ornithine antiporter ArcD n=1 Tax=Haladaptatus sp. R4 TaxID=1679489 RepID=UPI0007B4A065|nr:Na+/H+ antiporter NhaC [Haladaptatus sp. R4]KZN23632.1 arginine:ornithine antiporter [Haladaptatus sp. R4]
MPSLDFEPMTYEELPEERRPTFKQALLPVLATIVFLAVGSALLGMDPHMPLLWAITFTGLVGYYVFGYSWEELYDGLANSLMMGLQAILILFSIYALIATWISSGTIPGLMYYGLQLLSPSVFLPITAILSGLVAFSIGSSWTTVGTLGVAFIGIGSGLGIPAPMTAGAILSGAYAGDKQSPLSDTTNLAAAVTNTKLYDHINRMRTGTLLAFGLSVVLFAFFGLQASGGTEGGKAAAIQHALLGTYSISPLVFVPLVVTFGLALYGYPALPSLIAGIFSGAGTAILVQGMSFTAAWNVALSGTAPKTGMKLVNNLLANSGISGSAWTIAVVVLALALGGLLEKTGVLATLAYYLSRGLNSTGWLVFGTGISATLTNLLTAQQYMSIVVPGMTLRNVYDEHGLDSSELSRAVEAAGTPTGALIPWHAGAIYMAAALGVPTLSYAPFYFFGFLSPIILFVMAATGWRIGSEDSSEKPSAVASAD